MGIEPTSGRPKTLIYVARSLHDVLRVMGV